MGHVGTAVVPLVDLVVTGLAVGVVLAIAALEVVRTGTTADGVVAVTAVDARIAPRAGRVVALVVVVVGVVARTARDAVVAVAAVDVVAAVTAVDGVVAVVAVDTGPRVLVAAAVAGGAHRAARVVVVEGVVAGATRHVVVARDDAVAFDAELVSVDGVDSVAAVNGVVVRTAGDAAVDVLVAAALGGLAIRAEVVEVAVGVVAGITVHDVH